MITAVVVVIIIVIVVVIVNSQKSNKYVHNLKQFSERTDKRCRQRCSRITVNK